MSDDPRPPTPVPQRPTLAGLRVLVTRPAHQAEPLRRMIEARGGEAPVMPLLTIESAYDDAAARILEDALAFDGWIFTSANAVRYAAELESGGWPTLYAVGNATAQALTEAGHGGALVPLAGSSSEGLLALPALQALAGRRYLIVTGEGGRSLLADTLRERGAEVETVALYRRRPVEYAAARVTAEIDMADVIVLTSGGALEHLWQLTPESARASLLRRKLVVPSPRVVEKALELGFAAPLVPDEVADAAIVRSLELWREPPAATQATRPDMSETPLPIPPPPVAAPSSGRAYAALAWLLVVCLLAALGYAGWLLWQARDNTAAALEAQTLTLRQLTAQVVELESDAAQLNTRQSDLARVTQRNGIDVASIQGRLEDSQAVMGRLTEELQGGRTRFQLAAIEHLLLLANDRLLLEHDVSSAQQALEIADRRLAEMNEPRLFKVREALAAERAALAALPRPDLASAALTLSSLIDRAPRLPLRARVPDHFEAHPELGEFPAALPWYARLRASVAEALRSIFTVRRDDNARALRLLPADQEAVVYQVLELKLEGARIALLRGNGVAFRDLLRAAGDWLDEYFKPDDPGVSAAQAELERLQPLELSPPLPDITRSLALLRAQLEAAPR